MGCGVYLRQYQSGAQHRQRNHSTRGGERPSRV
jgi:hypothetical protein